MCELFDSYATQRPALITAWAARADGGHRARDISGGDHAHGADSDRRGRRGADRDAPNRGGAERDAPNRGGAERDVAHRGGAEYGAAHRDGTDYGAAHRDGANGDAPDLDGARVGGPGRDGTSDGGQDGDGVGGAIPEDLAWQPRLWRLLRAEIGTPSPAERLEIGCAALRDRPDLVDLPARLSLFGVHRLPADQLAVLTALGASREIHLWLTHPSPAMWSALSDIPASTRRATDRTAHTVAHPLLTGLARDARELQQRLTSAAASDERLGPVASGRAAEFTSGVTTRSAPGAASEQALSVGAEFAPAAAERASGVTTPASGDTTGLGSAAGADLAPRRTTVPGPTTEPVRGLPTTTSESERTTGLVSETERTTLLGAMVAGIRDDRWPPRERVRADGSVRVHACHGAARQVEVLRDALLGLFARDPTLEPRDVVIMCPEVEAYAPLILAAFGVRTVGEPVEAGAHPARQLRVRLADRGRATTNPLLAVVATLLELADGRVTVTQVLDLAAAETVRRRCGFDDDAIERLREWAAESGARWGIGQRQRQAFGLADFGQNTLNGAVDRILLGVAADDTARDWLDLALPLDDVDSNDVDLAGRFAEFIDRLAVCLRDLRGPAPAREWAAVLARALDLLTDVPEAQAWVRAEAKRELAAALDHAGDTALRLADVDVLLAGRLAAAPPRANFRTGELTVCALAPMRSVPHRVVVLLGLDDEVFPRPGGADGDDVLARDPLPGERDPRAEDRQILLDCVLAARERLLVFYSGADPVSGAERPPAIPVAELLDVVRGYVGDDLTGVLVRHPLQSFDGRNFRADDPFSFDTVALAGAVAAAAPACPRPAFLRGPLPTPDLGDVALADLLSFVEHPVRAFLWQRLGLRVPEYDDDIADRIPIELDGLAKWELGERMLTARLTGADGAELRAAEWRRGTLPPFGLGAAVLDEIEYTVDTLVRACEGHYRVQARAVDIAIDLGNGRRLTGTVPEVRGEQLVRTTYSKLAPKHRLAAWVSVLALSATEDRGWQAVTTGRGQFRRPAWRSELTAPAAPEAVTILRELVKLRDAGLAEPLPIAPTATAAYAERRFRGGSADEAFAAAEREFDGGPNGPGKYGDHTDRHLRYIWGAAPRLDDLTAVAAQAGERGENTRFGAIARRLWAPLLAAETQGQP
ncbi:exodeoxyribonuclease V subunit gamma [Nocardia sp. NEAU-351]|uniref:RecBCD enzyme subunit RecC n=1 Tax=Nocardia bovistercoris TaxID=2785916 RepID=A0A931N365_9NOCA|nr:exodeoxyribonuclease V subunit gamma [Nocardia bovistercoris]